MDFPTQLLAGSLHLSRSPYTSKKVILQRNYAYFTNMLRPEVMTREVAGFQKVCHKHKEARF